MAYTLDAGKLCFDELNKKLRLLKETEIELNNIMGHRYIGGGVKGKRITVNGVAGNALGAYLNECDITVNGPCQDAAGDTMNNGSIVIHGHAGDTVGYGMRGGEIYVRDYAGFRVGIHMKEYGEHIPKIVIGGSAGDFLGEYQAGGIILVLGLGAPETKPCVGSFCGTGMHGGRIFVRGSVPPSDIPSEVQITPNADKTAVIPLIQKYCELFSVNPSPILDSPFYMLTPSTSHLYKRMYCNRNM